MTKNNISSDQSQSVESSCRPPQILAKPTFSCKSLTYHRIGTMLNQGRFSDITELNSGIENDTNASMPKKYHTQRISTATKQETCSHSLNDSDIESQVDLPLFKNGMYEMVKIIGQGMTSKVFQIRMTLDPELMFALKIITNEYYAQQPDLIQNEIDILKKFRYHPNIVNLIDHGKASFREKDEKEFG